MIGLILFDLDRLLIVSPITNKVFNEFSIWIDSLVLFKTWYMSTILILYDSKIMQRLCGWFNFQVSNSGRLIRQKLKTSDFVVYYVVVKLKTYGNNKIAIYPPSY